MLARIAWRVFDARSAIRATYFDDEVANRGGGHLWNAWEEDQLKDGSWTLKTLFDCSALR